MAISYTSRRDLNQALFKWQCVCLGLWLALTLYLNHEFPHDGFLLLFILPAIGFFGIGMLPGTGIDFQGLLFSGSFFCSYLSPALFNALAENHIGELMAMAFYILFAMAFGFVFFRLMGKLYQHTA